jgi:two-component system phosphate regulon sensor histidine kinase PhoR
MNKKQRKILIIIIVVASIGLITAQGVWLSGVYTSNENSLNTVINDALSSAITKVWQKETYTQMQDEMRRNIPGLVSDSAVSDFLEKYASDPKLTGKMVKRNFAEKILERLIMIVPIEQRVTVMQIDTLLKKEFSLSGISLVYELAVCDLSDRILMCSESYQPGKRNAVYEKLLFPNDYDDFPDKHYLKVYFPDRNIFLFKQISPFIFTSVMLVSVIFAIFIYTLWVILKQKKISEIKGDFVSNITHELKTPISTISLAAQLLEDPNVSDEVKNPAKLSRMIKEQSKHLSYLVEKVLQTSVFERKTIVLKLKPDSLHARINEAVDIMSLQFKNKKANLIVNLNATDDNVMIDKPYFLNVITNLLDNAIKYCRINPEIKITTVNKRDFIIMSVSDNGIGISPANQIRLFEPFFRVSSGNVHDVKGFGLGLNYVKKIMELSNGSVTLESKENIGTTFYLRLPLCKKQ